MVNRFLQFRFCEDHALNKPLQMGWTEATDLILKGMGGAIEARIVTCDFARLMEGATLVKASEFGQAIVGHM